MNRFGGDLNTGIVYGVINDSVFGKPNSGYAFALRERIHADCRFSRDLFETIFYGNKKFAGQNASLGNFNFNYLDYQQVSFSWIRTISNHTFGAGLSFLKGFRGINITADKANLFTQENGEFLDFDMQATMHRTDSTKIDYMNLNGIGTSIDLSYIYSKNPMSRFTMEVCDAGFIWWNKQSSLTTIDTAAHFEGVEVKDILKFDSLGNKTSSDSITIQDILKESKYASYRSTLPMDIRISYERIMKGRWKIFYGVRYMLFANYFPEAKLYLSYFVTPRFTITTGESFGGYSKFNTGIGATKEFKNGWSLSANSAFIDGYLLQKKTGQGFYCSIKKTF